MNRTYYPQGFLYLLYSGHRLEAPANSKARQMSMTILALDPGLTTTGWAKAVEETHEISYGTIEPGRRLRGPARLNYIYTELGTLVYGVDWVVIEGYSYKSKGAGAYQLGELGGVIRLLYEQCTADECTIVPPAQVKILATGRGNASKNAVLASAIRILGYEGDSDNEADARWMLEAVLHYIESPMRTELPKKNFKVIDKIFSTEVK